MSDRKTAFALFFGNRGFFPASLQASARREMTEALGKLGHKTIVLDETATRHGAVETPAVQMFIFCPIRTCGSQPPICW